MNDKIKTILVGDSQVGKTSIIVQFIQETFQEEYVATYASEKSTKEVTFNIKKKEEKLTLEVWDTVGQEKMRAVNKIFMKGAKIVLLVYDITNKKSFEELKNYWYNQIIETNNKNEISFAVVGNKSDLYEEQQVEAEEGEKYAKEIEALFFECSAKDNDSICSVFTELTKDYYTKFLMEKKEDNNQNPKPSDPPTVKIENKNTTKQKTNEKSWC